MSRRALPTIAETLRDWRGLLALTLNMAVLCGLLIAFGG
jgi:hypothetical protein